VSTRSRLSFLVFLTISPVQYNVSFLPILDQINPIHSLYYSLFLNPVFISVPTVPATWPSHFNLLRFTNQYNSVSSTNHEATLYIPYILKSNPHPNPISTPIQSAPRSNPHPNLIRTSFCGLLKQKSQFAVPIRTFPSTARCLQGRLI